MTKKSKRLLAASIAAALFPIGGVHASQTYVEGNIYVAGDQVCYQGDLFEAKWWAGANDSPADVDTVIHPWETPWSRIQEAASECSGSTTGNQPPEVQLSANPSQPDPSGRTPVTLTADAFDADGDVLSYVWQQIVDGAPSVSITDADMPTASVLLPEATQPIQYRFQVTVSDGQEMVTESLSFLLEPLPGNRSPTASVSAGSTEIVGAATISLSGAGSSDPDGDVLSYRWQQIAPATPLAVFDDAAASEPNVTLPAPETETNFVFELMVSDGELTDAASIVITQRTAATTGSSCDLWQASQIYTEGDLVSYGGEVWRAHWWTQGEQPGTTGEWGVWRLPENVTDCSVEPAPGPNPDPQPGDPSVVKLSELQAAEAALTSDPLLASVKQSIATLDNAGVEAITAGNTGNPANVRRIEQIVGEADWEYLFPRRAPQYTYGNFLRAVGKFPAFCGNYTDGRDADAICRRALATMFAHFTQETGGHTAAWQEPEWRQGLVYLRELGWSEDMANGYGLCDPSTWQGSTYPCAAFETGHPNAGQFKSYFGRGAKQLSYNYNYGPFSEAMYGDVNTLLQLPNLVADTWLNLASAIFFYVYPQPPKPSMLHALDGSWQPNQHDLDNGLSPGFGVTTQIINGGIECGGSAEHIQSQNRIDYFLNFADYLGVTVHQDEVLGCANMQRFDTQGSGALSIYWEQDWSQPNACQRVNYQTPFSALTEGDYVKCVEHYFNVAVDYDN